MAYRRAMELEELKEQSVRIYNGMIAVYPQFGEEEALDISSLIPKFNGCYASNNSTVCYVTENEVYVTPYTHAVRNTLCDNCFMEKSFFVPFSNWDYPKDEQQKWESLRGKAMVTYAEEFVDDCARYCDEHYISFISEESLKECFEMPANGVRVKHIYYEDCYFPVINNICFDSVAARSIGRFCTNNGRVVFVYRNGKTYVTKGYKILRELRDAGYVESSIFVPFSNGEEILDPVLKARWDAIKK